MDKTPENLVALYAALAPAEAALHELQDNDIPYASIRMATHNTADVADRSVAARAPGDTFWSVSVAPGAAGERAEQVLRAHGPFALGQQATGAPQHEVDQGAVAWRHYVFESPAATAAVSDAAGQSGTTGIVNSGVFADEVNAQDKPKD